MDGQDPMKDEVPHSDNDELINNDLDALSKGDISSEENDIETEMSVCLHW